MDMFYFEKYDYFPHPGLMFKPPILAEMFHAVPHFTSELGIGNDFFDLDSIDYRNSLIVIVALPLVLAAFYVIPLIVHGVWGLFLRSGEGSTWPRVRFLLTMMVVGLILCGLFLEYMIHSTVEKLLETEEYNFFLSSRLLELREHVAKFRISAMSESDAYYTNMHFRALYEKRFINNLVLYDNTAYPYYYVLAFFYQEVNLHLAQIQFPDLPPYMIELSFRQTLTELEARRLNIASLVWLTGLVLPPMRPSSIWCTALAGMVWSALVAGALVGVSVALADLCHEPEIISAKYSNKTFAILQMDEKFPVLCADFNAAAFQAQRDFVKPYERWWPTLMEMQNECYYGCTSALYSFVKRMQNRFYYVMYYNETRIFANLTLLNCEEQQYVDADVPEETLTPLCENDVILKWLYLEIMVAAAMEMIYGLLLLFCVHSIKNIKKYTLLNEILTVMTFTVKALGKSLKITPLIQIIHKTLVETVKWLRIAIVLAVQCLISTITTLIKKLISLIFSGIKAVLGFVFYWLHYGLVSFFSLFRGKKYREQLKKRREQERAKWKRQQAAKLAKKERIKKREEQRKLAKKLAQSQKKLQDDYKIEPMVVVDVNDSTKILVPLTQLSTGSKCCAKKKKRCK